MAAQTLLLSFLLAGPAALAGFHDQGQWIESVKETNKNRERVAYLCNLVVEAYNRCHPDAFLLDEENLTITTKAGKTIPCTDGEAPGFYERMNNMDLISMLSFPYSTGKIDLPVREFSDPGRLRNHELMQSVYMGVRSDGKAPTYGDEEESLARRNLVPVSFLGQKVPFNKRNGAAAALAKVSEQLMREIVHSTGSANKEAKSFLRPFLDHDPIAKRGVNLKEYTFYYRKVRGTNFLSTHSYGTGIDLITGKESEIYWLFTEARRQALAQLKLQGLTQETSPALYKELFNKYNREIREENTPLFVPEVISKVPQPIVDIFERNGFIWGGKWNHFDSMHFEYRPEFFPDYKIQCD